MAEKNVSESSTSHLRSIFRMTDSHLNQVIQSFHIDFKSHKTELCEIDTRLSDDKSSQHPNAADKRHPYTLLYRALFRHHRNAPLHICEIEVTASLMMWQEYFSQATIHGFAEEDTHLRFLQDTLQPPNDRVQVSKMNLKHGDDIQHAFSSVGEKWELIIKHSTGPFEDQILLIKKSIPFLCPGGMLILEDVCRQEDESRYWQELQPALMDFQRAFFVTLHHDKSTKSTRLSQSKLLILIKSGAASIFTPDTPRLHIITPSCRPQNLPAVKDSLRFEHVKQWTIVYDGARVPPSMSHQFPRDGKIREYIHSSPGISGNPQRNFALDQLGDIAQAKGTYLYFLDDDNQIHPGLYDLLPLLDDGCIYTFNQSRREEIKHSQIVHGEYCLTGNRPEPDFIDSAMALMDAAAVADIRWDVHKYNADGFYIRDCAKAVNHHHIWVNNTLCHYNNIK